MKVHFLAAEAAPLVQVGGLAEVAGALPGALRELGVEVFPFLPLYPQIRRDGLSLEPLAQVSIPTAHGPVEARLYLTRMESGPLYLVDGDPLRAADAVYEGPQADGWKFIFFSLAALALAQEALPPAHLVHAHDWHAAPALVHLHHRAINGRGRPATLLTVHNLPYQGAGSEPALRAYGLAPPDHAALPEWARWLPLAMGIAVADHVNTVSPGYAREILTPEFGAGLEGLLKARQKDLSGILNGLDILRWDPRRDRQIPVRFSATCLERRRRNKAALQKRCGLPVDLETPLLIMVGRLDAQKGVDLALDALSTMGEAPWQLVVLGRGDPALEARVRAFVGESPERARAIVRYDMQMSRWLYAGGDLILIPSRYEPCGLAQMIAMRYGCLPLVSRTGGLQDTVRDVSQGERATGFVFHPITAQSMAEKLRLALALYRDPGRWRAMQVRGMRRRFSWRRSARRYLELYTRLAGMGRAAEGRA